MAISTYFARKQNHTTSHLPACGCDILRVLEASKVALNKCCKMSFIFFNGEWKMKHIFHGIYEHNITTETNRILGHNFVLVNLQVALHAWVTGAVLRYDDPIFFHRV